MSPIAWALQPLKKYAQFSGRAPRAEFWWFMLFVIILYIVLSFFMVGSLVSLGSAAQEGADPTAGMLGAMGGGMIFMLLFWLVLLIPTLAVQTRRLHDTGRSGWWLGGFYILYAVYFAMLISAGAMAGAGAADPEQALGGAMVGTMFLGLVMMVYGIALIVFYCLPGTKGANKYGPDPYGPQDVGEVFA